MSPPGRLTVPRKWATATKPTQRSSADRMLEVNPSREFCCSAKYASKDVVSLISRSIAFPSALSLFGKLSAADEDERLSGRSQVLTRLYPYRHGASVSEHVFQTSECYSCGVLLLRAHEQHIQLTLLLRVNGTTIGAHRAFSTSSTCTNSRISSGTLRAAQSSPIGHPALATGARERSGVPARQPTPSTKPLDRYGRRPRSTDRVCSDSPPSAMAMSPWDRPARLSHDDTTQIGRALASSRIPPPNGERNHRFSAG